MRFNLIQRGRFEKIDDLKSITGLDGLIRWDYMGSAEFEFGALPKSLAHIMEMYEKEKFVMSDIIINDLPFVLYASDSLTKEDFSDISKLFNEAAKGKFSPSHLKEPLNISEYFAGEKIEKLKRNCKKKREVVDNYFYCDFWWDVDNHYFVIPAAYYYVERVGAALRALQSRQWLKGFLERNPRGIR